MDVSLDWLVATFALGDPITSVLAGRGQTNPYGVMRVSTTSGLFAIKFYDHQPDPKAMIIENAAFAAGFPMSQPVYAVNGEKVVFGSDAGIPRWVRVYRWITGAPVDWGVVDPVLAAQMGSLLATMHMLSVPPEALQADVWTPIGRSGWEDLWQKAQSNGLQWASLLREKIPALLDIESFIHAGADPIEPLAPSQRDLHPPNIVRKPDGGHAVIDWDAAGPVNAREEVAMFALVWATGEGSIPDPLAVRAFICGYLNAGGQYKTHGIHDLVHQKRSLHRWILYNIRRHIDVMPGPNPWLPAALLEGIKPIDVEELKHIASLFAV